MKKNRNQLILNCIFLMLLLGYSLLTYILVHRMAVQATVPQSGLYKSDILAYMQEMQGIDSGFDFPYPLFFWLGRFFMLFCGVEIAVSLAVTALNALAVMVTFYFLQKYLPGADKENGFPKGLVVLFLTFSLFWVSMLYAPEGIYLPGMTHKYLGVFTPNPLHNATYMATRPFAIVTFFLFVKILDKYEKEADYKLYSWFGLFLFLTTITKPSFTLLFVSAAGLVMAGRLLLARFSNLKNALKLTAFFVPTFLCLLCQFGGVFGASSKAGEEGGIGFGFGDVWRDYMDNIPLAIILALAFPGLVLCITLLFDRKTLRENTLYRFAWISLIVSLLEFFFLYEKGERYIHANFSWGYMHGQFFVFLAMMIYLAQKSFAKPKSGKDILLLILQWGALLWHLLCGIGFFAYMWSGQFYYCF